MMRKIKKRSKINERCLYGKTTENLRNKIDVRLVSKDKDHLKSKMDIKTKLYVSKNISQ